MTDVDEVLMSTPPEGSVPRDSRGRYLLPDSHGVQRTWTRATTLAAVLEDRWAITKWEQRAIVFGMGKRPDLVALAQSAEGLSDKPTLNPVVQQALDAAGTSEGANRGTALHNVRAMWDLGVFHDRMNSDPNIDDADVDVAAIDYVPEPFREDIMAYARCLDAAGIDVLPEYVELTVRNEALGVVGTLDGIGRRRSDGVLVVLDLKSEKDPTEYGQVYKTVQLGAYQSADAMWDSKARALVPMPRTSPHVALIIHLRPGSGTALPYQVNPTLGYAIGMTASEGLRYRKMTRLVTPYFDAAAQNTPASEAPPFAQDVLSQAVPMRTPDNLAGDAEFLALMPASSVTVGGVEFVERIPEPGEPDPRGWDGGQAEAEATLVPEITGDPETQDPSDFDGPSGIITAAEFVADVLSKPKPDKAHLQRTLKYVDPGTDGKGVRKTLAQKLFDACVATDSVPVINDAREIDIVQRAEVEATSPEGAAPQAADPVEVAKANGFHTNGAGEQRIREKAAAASTKPITEQPTWPNVLKTTHSMIDMCERPDDLLKLRGDFVARHGDPAWVAELNDHAKARYAELSAPPAAPDIESLISNALDSIARAADLAALTAVWSKWTEVTGFDWNADPRTTRLVTAAAARRDEIVAANPMSTNNPFE